MNRGRSPRAALVFALAGALGGCTPAPGAPREYQTSDLALLTAHAAKEMCSCVFVMRQTDAFCAAWVRANPAVNTMRIDRTARSVESQAGVAFGARAHWVSPHAGCVLE